MKQFKMVHLIVALVLLLLGTLPATAAPAQPYQISHYTIDGGARLGNSGGRFQLSGTIGQADSTGVLAAGPYTYSGGFWRTAAQVNSTGANQLFLPMIVR